jgi:pimeloyl-ACP methyl ester carboxylesterase
MRKTVDGIQVNLYGDRSKQPIVFIHGFPFDHTLWDDVIPELEDEYYCISYDIKGFGASEQGSGQYTMESYVDNLGNLIDHLEVVNPIIVGFSMGGYIALRANEKFKSKFKALILANTKTAADDDAAKLKRASAIANIEDEGIEPFLDTFFSVAFSEQFIEKKPQVIETLKTKIMHFSPVGIKGGLLAMISRTDTTQSLEDTELPVLLISGENDKIISPDIMEHMANSIQNSTYISLKDSGHMSMVENPKGFIHAVKRFLKKYSS